MVTPKLTKYLRIIIRKHAKSCGCRYRITRDGEVHYYGISPSTNNRCWYFVSFDALSWADRISTK